MNRFTRATRRAFSLAELLVVVGVIALLLAIILPPLSLAKQQAMRVHCMVNLQQIGVALDATQSEYGYYPLWDDGREPVRHTWLDVLIQRRMLSDYRVGYCPEDARPDPLNRARGRAVGVYYPGSVGATGIDYSYGIGVPLSAGGWNWSGTDRRPRRFIDHERHTSRRILAGDAYWSAIYNTSGDGIFTGIWNDPTWYDNTIGWRHAGFSANLLKQDGHVEPAAYNFSSDTPVLTTSHFVWYPGEPMHVGPDSRRGDNWYPLEPPPHFASEPRGEAFPDELNPVFYTARQLWTLIPHK